MYRLHRVTSSNIQNLIRCSRRRLCAKPNEQPTSIPPHTPMPKPKRNYLGLTLKILGGVTLLQAGAVGVAWYSPQYRKLMEDNIIYYKEWLEFVFKYLPERSESESVSSKAMRIRSITSGEVTMEPMVDNPLEIKEQGLWKRPQKKEAELIAVEEKTISSKPVTELQAEQVKNDSSLKQEVDEIHRREEENQLDAAAENAALETILTEMVEVLSNVSRDAVDAYSLAVDKIREHKDLVRKAMDNVEGLEQESQWQSVTRAQQLKEQTLEQAQKAKDLASEQLEKLKHTVTEGRKNSMTAKNKALITVDEITNKKQYDLSKAESQMEKAQSEMQVMLRYKDLVDKGRKQFKRELESILPEVKLGGKRGNKLTQDDLNSLIAHAHRRIEQLQRQLAEQQVMEGERLEDALIQQQKDDSLMTENVLQQELNKQQNEFHIEKQKLAAEAYVQFEEELRQQLARQAAAHSDHLADVLRVQRHEADIKFGQELRERLIKQREVFHGEVSGWIARLKGIESAVEGRAALERQVRNSQELWLACQTLLEAIEEGNEKGAEWEEKLKPLSHEVEAVREAGDAQPFVDAVVDAIPTEALTRGVWTETSLRQRFWNVKRVCRRVAMIDETGGTLFKYFLSYLQSMITFDTAKAVSENDIIDKENLDTFSLLAHASRCLQNDNLEQAVRYINQLEGMPRKIASDWLKEARLLLETRQAAFVLSSHASGNGLGALF